MNIELKPCPFCGGRPAIEDVTWEFELIGANKQKKSWWVVECSDCHARTQPYSIQEKAVEAWQKRNDSLLVLKIKDFKKVDIERAKRVSEQIKETVERNAREQRSEEAYVVDIRDLKKAIVDNPYDPSKEIAGYLRYLRYNTPRYEEGESR